MATLRVQGLAGSSTRDHPRVNPSGGRNERKNEKERMREQYFLFPEECSPSIGNTVPLPLRRCSPERTVVAPCHRPVVVHMYCM